MLQRCFLLGACCLWFGLAAGPALADEPARELTPAERLKLMFEARKLDADALQLFDAGKPAEAVQKLEQALAIQQKLFQADKFPDGHANLSAAMSNLGEALTATGSYEKALDFFQKAVDIDKKLYPINKYPDGHPSLAISMNNVASALASMGLYEKALEVFLQSLAMREKIYTKAKYPDGHSDLAMSLNNVGETLTSMGSYEKAMEYYQKALNMQEKLYPVAKYPHGHPFLATCLSNLGFLFHQMEGHEKALVYYRRALAMDQKLFPPDKFPDGHPNLAADLNNLAGALDSLGSHEEALVYYRKTLAMQEKLYPQVQYANGHPQLADALDNLGVALSTVGSNQQAEPLHRKALAMRQKLYPPRQYPDGHPAMAISLNNLGSVLSGLGSDEKALDCYRKALAMKQKLLDREIVSATEAQALAQIASLRGGTSDSLLDAALHVPDSAAAAYQVLWYEKGAVYRLLARRHISVSIERQQSDEVRQQYEQLCLVRREIGRLISLGELDDRSKRLGRLRETEESLERELAKKIPGLERDKELAQLQPNDLLGLLPAQTALVDVMRYQHFEQGKLVAPRYVAFVLQPSRQGEPRNSVRNIQRVELGDAQPIDAAVSEWRVRIERREDGVPDALTRMWRSVARQLPEDTRTLYLCPDGDLARIPLCALPGSKAGTLLLEEFMGGVAIVPHSRFLVEQWKYPPKSFGPADMLSVTNVDYGTSAWTKLPGTEAEGKTIAAISTRQQQELTGRNAVPSKLIELLPNVGYAHFATHGFFNESDVAAERGRQQVFWKQRVGGGARPLPVRNPLGYVGLALANGDILSGLSIVDLPLENLKLVTLSACETGLGEYTGGEGVQGLQRAFHLAGCANVIGSLWNVNDAATAALMAKFYHELWVNKKPPIEALREAQLTIYYHPDLIPDLAGERGAPKLKEAVTVKNESTAQARDVRKRADTKLWSAFVLSGVGK
ncbi:MAG TPA: CHAT domain-containing tetratricopeptide repeat protein [Gemmataceae bacterium]|nr:CHAT domain-containing tetratricopeptide repeat protein [Gemmataceae bacterium]